MDSVGLNVIMELDALILQTAVTFGLAGLCLWLYREYRKPVFAWWAAAWGLYVLRSVVIGSFLIVRDDLLLYWHQVFTGWTALAVLATALVFSRRLQWKTWYLLLVLFPPVWAYIAIYRIDNFTLAAGPAVLFLSIATLWTGVVFFRYTRHSRSPGAALLATAFILWGLHHLDYPFLRAKGAWAPWGYYLDVLFILAVGTGMLLLIADDLREGAKALAKLTSVWEGASTASRDTLLDHVLTRVAALPAVRGAVLVRSDTGTYDRGAGVCAQWSGAVPGAEDALVLRSVATHGEAVFVPSWRAPSGDTERAASQPPRHFKHAAVLPVPVDNGTVQALVIVANDSEPFAALDPQFLAAFGKQLGGTLAFAALTEALHQRTTDLERLSARMVDQHEEERRRLARELHDETAQLLAAVKMELGVLRTTVNAPQAARIDEALALTDAGIRSIRAVIQDLRPSLLDDLGLVPALRSVVASFADRSEMDVSLDLSRATDFPPLTPDTELALFRAVQEALSNVARHAEARQVWVTVTATPSHITLSVRDDGRGVQRDQLARSLGTGVAGIHERFAQYGGRVTLTAHPTGGASLEAFLPITLHNTRAAPHNSSTRTTTQAAERLIVHEVSTEVQV